MMQNTVKNPAVLVWFMALLLPLCDFALIADSLVLKSFICNVRIVVVTTPSYED